MFYNILVNNQLVSVWPFVPIFRVARLPTDGQKAKMTLVSSRILFHATRKFT